MIIFVEKCVELMVSKAHLTQEGLEEIIHILISNNKSLHSDLLKLHSYTKKLDRLSLKKDAVFFLKIK